MGVKPRAIHFRHPRLFVNAGMDFPACCAGAKLLDLDKCSWPTTADASKVTCKRCREYIARRRKGIVHGGNTQ